MNFQSNNECWRRRFEVASLSGSVRVFPLGRRVNLISYLKYTFPFAYSFFFLVSTLTDWFYLTIKMDGQIRMDKVEEIAFASVDPFGLWRFECICGDLPRAQRSRTSIYDYDWVGSRMEIENKRKLGEHGFPFCQFSDPFRGRWAEPVTVDRWDYISSDLFICMDLI